MVSVGWKKKGLPNGSIWCFKVLGTWTFWVLWIVFLDYRDYSGR